MAFDTQIDLTHQSGAAVVTVLLMDYLKQAKWFPWMSCNTEKLNRVVSVAMAVGTTLGFSVVSHEGTIFTGGQVTISYPALRTLVETTIHILTQFGLQELGHKMMGNHTMLKILLDQTKKVLDQAEEILTQTAPDAEGADMMIAPPKAESTNAQPVPPANTVNKPKFNW